MAKGSGKFSQKNRDSGLGKLVDEALTSRRIASPSEGPNALEFIEDKQFGFGVTLSQVQRIMVKITFGIPMDFRMGKVPVWDMYKEKLLYTFENDIDYLSYVYNEGRTNISNWLDASPFGYSTVNLIVGRRGGKSEIVAAMGGVKLKNLLTLYDPQDYYGLIKGSPIDLTMLGTDEESSTTVFDKLSARINACSFFNPYIRQNDKQVMTFVSEADRHNRDIRPSITAAAYACTTRGIRGPSSIFLALDEFAHFRSSKDANSEDIWTAATPSTARFPNKQDPERVDSLIMMISSPLNKIGQMYESHKNALEEGITSETFTFRCSTVEMFPLIPRARLAQFRKESGDAYKAEYGGEFLDGAGSYIPPQKFNICIDEERENLTQFAIQSVGRKYFWAVDYGTQNDATALAIGHLEMVEGLGVGLIFDYIDRMMVGEPFTGPGVLNGERVKNMTELDIRDVISWLVYMHNVLPCYRGVTDQHGGTTLKQLLQINGITTMELVHLTDQINSKMYYALKGYVENGTASFPNVSKFKTEFNMLEASFKSKYVLKVEAPKERGAHDDMADAAALVAWLAQLWLEDEGKLDLDPTGRALQVNPRIMNPNVVINPNDVTLRDLQVGARMDKLGIGLMLPPALQIVKNPHMHGQPRGRRR